MNPLTNLKRIYFIGIGGIGMSALARYFNTQGVIVAGYDKTPTELTNSLEAEGIKIHFEDYDIEIDKTCIAKYKNIGLYIHKNHIIDFLNKINEYYFIHKITNNNNGKVIFKYDRDDDNNITDINNITNEIEQQIYDLVVKINE